MPDMANDPVAWKSDYLRSSGQLSGCVLRHDASRVLVVEGAQRVGLVIDKWGCRSHSSNLPRITGDSHETIAPFAPLHGAGVERTGLNVFAVSGCVPVVFVGEDYGQYVPTETISHSSSPPTARLIRGGIHDLTA
jgi:hypothetical protein